MLAIGMPGGAEWGILVAVLLLMGGVVRSRGGVIPKLVLRQFRVDATGAGGKFVEIAGRRQGLVAWFLTMLRLDTEVTLVVTDAEVVFKLASLGGQEILVVPLWQVASMQCAYSRPVLSLIAGVVFLVVGLGALVAETATGAGVALVVAALCLWQYWTNQYTMLGVESTGGRAAALRFKPSIIEGVRVDLATTRQAIHMLAERAQAAKTGAGPAGVV